MPLFGSLGLGHNFGRLPLPRSIPGFSYVDAEGNTQVWDLANGDFSIEAAGTTGTVIELTALSNFTAVVQVLGGSGGATLNNAPELNDGSGSGHNSGTGAMCYGVVSFVKGQLYRLFAGGHGIADLANNYGAGGGAASGLLDYKYDPVIIAGGGGGAAYTATDDAYYTKGGSGGGSGFVIGTGGRRPPSTTNIGNGASLTAPGIGRDGGLDGIKHKGGKGEIGRYTSLGGDSGIPGFYFGNLGGKFGGGGGAGGYFGGGGGGADGSATNIASSGGGGSSFADTSRVEAAGSVNNSSGLTPRTMKFSTYQAPGKAIIYQTKFDQKNIVATGGEITDLTAADGTIIRQHVFKTSDVFTIESCSQDAYFEVMINGGGGGGGHGFAVQTTYTVTLSYISSGGGRVYYNVQRPTTDFYAVTGGKRGDIDRRILVTDEISSPVALAVAIGAGGQGVSVKNLAGYTLSGQPGSSSYIANANNLVYGTLGSLTVNGGARPSYIGYDNSTAQSPNLTWPAPAQMKFNDLTDLKLFKGSDFYGGGDGGNSPNNYARSSYHGAVSVSTAGSGRVYDNYGSYGINPLTLSEEDGDWETEQNILDAEENSGSGGGSVTSLGSYGDYDSYRRTSSQYPDGFHAGNGGSGIVVIRYPLVPSGTTNSLPSGLE